jgi:glyoxylase-like metal-dependent hydrolase (beta-lactamase superfamily II)
MDPADKVMLENDHLLTESFHLKAPDVDFQTLDLKERDITRFADEQLEAIATPGHTPGGISFLDRKAKVLFSGDTLFAGSIGRTDHPWGDYDKLIKSVMDKLMGLDGDTVVIPGHGQRTTIGAEVAHNPFLIPFNEPESDWNGMEGIELDGNENKK